MPQQQLIGRDEKVFAACAAIASENDGDTTAVTVARVVALVGGSNSAVGPLVKQWKLQQTSGGGAPALPPEVIGPAHLLWEAAVAKAGENSIALKNEIEILILEKQNESERVDSIISGLETHRDAILRECQALKESDQRSITERRRLEHELVDLKRQLNEELRQSGTLKQENIVLQKDIDARQATIEAQSAQLVALKTAETRILEQLGNQQQTLQAERDRFDRTEQRLLVQIDELKQTIKAADVQIQYARTESVKLKAERADQDKAFQVMASAQAELQRELFSVQKEQVRVGELLRVERSKNASIPSSLTKVQWDYCVLPTVSPAGGHVDIPALITRIAGTVSEVLLVGQSGRTPSPIEHDLKAYIPALHDALGLPLDRQISLAMLRRGTNDAKTFDLHNANGTWECVERQAQASRLSELQLVDSARKLLARTS